MRRIPSRKELLGAEDPERLAELAPDQVLSPLAARQGEVRGLRALMAREHDEELGVLVVGVRADHQHPLVVPEELELLQQRRKPAGGRRFERATLLGGGRRRGKDRDGEEDRHHRQCATRHPRLRIKAACKIASIVHL